MATMTTSELKTLLSETDARIRDLEYLIRTTPAGTLAARAMSESYPELIRFRARVDDELYRRGA